MTQIQTSQHTLSVEGELGPFELSHTIEQLEAGLELIHLKLSSEEAAVPAELTLRWMYPSSGVHGSWSPNHGYFRAVSVEWAPGVVSKATSGAPIYCSHSFDGTNKLTFAFSDALNTVRSKAGVREESAELNCSLTLFSDPLPPLTTYEATLRIDTRAIPYHQAINDVSQWWAAMPVYAPSPVPEAARQPMYSTWYSFHQQLTPEGIEEQCRLAKELGCEAVIVDDGWQTDDNARGYAFCGDWRPTTNKFPDMKAHVQRVHDLGLKYLIWYSVPFVGEHSEAWQQFKNKMLRYLPGKVLDTHVLDPRFPEVREYLINLYENAVREWDIDGLKLDFVDDFNPDETTRNAFGDGSDYESVPAAVDRLLTDTMSRLRAIKPDIMIEFRQSYVGPLMRKYGNMFRAGDCPNDALTNRIRTLDIRLLSGNTACHSDMVMWHPEDSVESAAMQLAHVLFSVPQVSMLLDRLPRDHQEMVQFYLDFWREQRDVLLDGELVPHHPETYFPLVTASTPDKWLAAIYDETVVTLPHELPGQCFIVNGTLSSRVVLDVPHGQGSRVVEVRDCKGHVVRVTTIELDAGLHALEVPPAGIATLN